MKKVNTTVAVTTISGAQFTFADIADAKNGTSAASSIRNKEQIDAIGLLDGGSESRYIIPFHAIAEANITMTSEDAEIPSDDNCKSNGPSPEPTVGDFVIRNADDTIATLSISVSGNHIGTFGDVTFEDYIAEYDASIVGTAIDLNPQTSITISGLPTGTSVYLGGAFIGTVPGAYTVGDDPGPGPGPK